MENLLIQYLEKGFHEPEKPDLSRPKPFVTISREFGCPSKPVAEMLVEALNKYALGEKDPKWKMINKEVVEQAARELDLEPNRIKYLFNAERRGTWDDILASFSDNYKSNLKIKKTIKEVITSFALEGHVVLVGRGSVAITQSMPRSLHIRLQGPLEWRASEYAQRHDINYEEALKVAIETDKKRTGLIEIFLGKKFDPGIFDLIINCQRISKEDIVRTIVYQMQLRKMI
ncbi:MAG: cytidylate kinase-like family protein [Bacteroidota bacterium]|nr:cytidylate kinase-like family protein [Bacteroidota bacterium]